MRVNSYQIVYDWTRKGDLLRQVTAWAGLIIVKPVLRDHFWDKEKVFFL